MKVIGFIPVRYESSRLYGKALKKIAGIPAVVHVYKRSKLSKQLDDLYVVTDSSKIIDVLNKFNIKVIRTGNHDNGTERIFEASKKIKSDIIINIQGDEILVDPKNIDKLIKQMKKNKNYGYFLGITKFNQINQKNVFKAVINNNEEMIYCSREDIPSSSIIKNNNRLKVVFIVGYYKKYLNQFLKLQKSINELREPNEFLRIIDHGYKIKTVKFDKAEISLDTYSDLIKIKKLMKTDMYFNKNYYK